MTASSADLRRQFEAGPPAAGGAALKRGAERARASAHRRAGDRGHRSRHRGHRTPPATGSSDGCHELFSCMRRLLDAHSEERNEYDKRLRITPDVRQEPLWGEVAHAWDNLDLSLAAIARRAQPTDGDRRGPGRGAERRPGEPAAGTGNPVAAGRHAAYPPAGRDRQSRARGRSTGCRPTPAMRRSPSIARPCMSANCSTATCSEPSAR